MIYKYWVISLSRGGGAKVHFLLSSVQRLNTRCPHAIIKLLYITTNELKFALINSTYHRRMEIPFFMLKIDHTIVTFM